MNEKVQDALALTSIYILRAPPVKLHAEQSIPSIHYPQPRASSSQASYQSVREEPLLAHKLQHRRHGDEGRVQLPPPIHL